MRKYMRKKTHLARVPMTKVEEILLLLSLVFLLVIALDGYCTKKRSLHRQLFIYTYF